MKGCSLPFAARQQYGSEFGRKFGTQTGHVETATWDLKTDEICGDRFGCLCRSVACICWPLLGNKQRHHQAPSLSFCPDMTAKQTIKQSQPTSPIRIAYPRSLPRLLLPTSQPTNTPHTNQAPDQLPNELTKASATQPPTQPPTYPNNQPPN